MRTSSRGRGSFPRKPPRPVRPLRDVSTDKGRAGGEARRMGQAAALAGYPSDRDLSER